MAQLTEIMEKKLDHIQKKKISGLICEFILYLLNLYFRIGLN